MINLRAKEAERAALMF